MEKFINAYAWLPAVWFVVAVVGITFIVEYVSMKVYKRRYPNDEIYSVD